MIRRFKIMRDTHLGVIGRNVNVGDVIGIEPSGPITLNGVILKGVDVTRAEGFIWQAAGRESSNPILEEIAPISGSMRDVKIATNTQVVFPILGCLVAAEEHLKGEAGTWLPMSDDQYQFLRKFMPFKSDVPTLVSDGILSHKADKNASVINKWLSDNGFNIQLPDNGANEFSVASILKVLVEWVKAGTVTTVLTDKGTFPAVRFNDKNSYQKFVNREIHPFPVVRVKTKTGYTVCMTVLDNLSDSTFAISEKVDRVRKVFDGCPEACRYVIFPMIDYDRNVDISWIVGLNRGDWTVARAIQQTKFRMNEIGARAESAVAMTMRCMACLVEDDDPVIIDKPFLLWIESPNARLPVFAGVFAEDVWKKPETL